MNRDIIEIARKLIGPFQPTGDYDKDQERLQNLEEMIDLAHNLVSELKMLTALAGSDKETKKQAGVDAYRALKAMGFDFPRPGADKTEASISVSRTSSNGDIPEYMSIQICPEGDRKKRIRLDMSMAAFALAITGKSEQPCKIR